MTTMRTAATTMPMAESHAGTFASSPPRRRYTKQTPMTTASTTMAMSSCVMPARQVPEPVEDALPVLEMEEHRDPAGTTSKHGRA